MAIEARRVYDWDGIAEDWRRVFREAEARIPIMADDNPSLRKILEFVRSRGGASKAEILKHLQWAPKQRALSWTAFRRSLKALARDDPASPEAKFVPYDGHDSLKTTASDGADRS